jgi:GNAT superfamily N-acetyltransferase
MNEIEIHKGYVPGAIGRVVEMHGRYYHDHWEFGAFFEAKVAGGFAEFMNRYDDQRDGLWTAAVNGRVEGSIVIDGAYANQAGAHLRWFIISDALRGQGVGNRLIAAAVDFCRMNKYPRVYLWTFEGLYAARHLYEKAGFVLIEQRRGAQWGKEVEEQRFELCIP